MKIYRMIKSSVLGFAAMVFIASCGGHVRSEADASKKAEVVAEDSTFFATVKLVKENSIMLTDMEGKDMKFGLDKERPNSSFAGSLTQGDTLACMASQQGVLVSAVNLNELCNLWFFEDGSGNGIRLVKDGAACSVGLAEFSFRLWKFKNGQLVFTFVPSDGSDYHEQEEEIKIVEMNKKRFVYIFRGDTIQCSR